ncbi:MAG: hypothetical protein KDC47_07530, partial [Flavobacteriaceae bacterium]|nr:hypothetical protein [Flavobacteriaceae bacterium]
MEDTIEGLIIIPFSASYNAGQVPVDLEIYEQYQPQIEFARGVIKAGATSVTIQFAQMEAGFRDHIDLREAGSAMAIAAVDQGIDA